MELLFCMSRHTQTLVVSPHHLTLRAQNKYQRIIYQTRSAGPTMALPSLPRFRWLATECGKWLFL